MDFSFSDFNWGWHIIQLLTFIIVALVGRSFQHLLDELKGLRSETKKLRDDVKAEHERFKDYVQEEKCKFHREMIEKHISDSEARIEKMLSHCKRHTEEGIG